MRIQKALPFAIVALFILFSCPAKAQTLYVGASNPNQILTLSNTATYDSIIVLNRGILNLINANTTVNSTILVLNQGQLNVLGGSVEVRNQLLAVDEGRILIKGMPTLSCNLIAADKGSIMLDSSLVAIPMLYKDQYRWDAYQEGNIRVRACQVNCGIGSLGGEFGDSTSISIEKSIFLSPQIPLTMGFSGNSRLSVDSSTGGMEFIIGGASRVNISTASGFVIWYTFDPGDTVDYTYPAANSSTPGASDIFSTYIFSDSLPGVSGVDYRVQITNSQSVLWGILSNSGSSVTLNNSDLIACGFFFTNPALSLAAGFTNDSLYSSYSAPITDRTLAVNNSRVRSWNFYSFLDARLQIKNSLYGESILFGNSRVRIDSSVCDGTGGYFGGKDNGRMEVFYSTIKRIKGAITLINYSGTSELRMHHSVVQGRIVISDSAKAFLNNTAYDTLPLVDRNGLFAAAVLDSIPGTITSSPLPVTASCTLINGPQRSSVFTRYQIGWSATDSSGYSLIADTVVGTSSLTGTFANWNTSQFAPGDYLLWLVTYVDGDSANVTTVPVTVGTVTGLQSAEADGNWDLYPNPARDQSWLRLELKQRDPVRVEIWSSSGRLLHRSKTMGQGELALERKGLPAGLYYVRLYQGGQAVGHRKLIWQ